METPARDHSILDLDSLDQAREYGWERVAVMRQVGEDRAVALEAQWLWWMVSEVFAQHPGLGAVQFRDRSRDSTSAKLVVRNLDIRVWATGEDLAGPPHPATARELAKPLEQLRRLLGTYGATDNTALFSLLERAAGVRRDKLLEWDWGLAGDAWRARMQSRARAAHLDQVLEAGQTGGPGPRL